MKTKLFALEGKVQNYAWGGNSFIPSLIGVEKEDKPYAEYWMGAHNNAPSMVDVEGDKTPLNALIESQPEATLGKYIYDAFGRLPFLFKVLDVKDMLSIQVHPTKEEAVKGFKRENQSDIPLTASYRNYKDDNHKPEIMVALSEFWLLHGFRPKKELQSVLSSVEVFQDLLPVFEQEGYYSLYKTVMEYSQEEVNQKLLPLVNKIVPLYKEGKLPKSSADYWAAKAVVMSASENLDRGIFSIYFFNVVKAEKGEAIFQDAGVPHAYLEGQNMELMANSDNVLRGGLTPKHVDVPELLKHVKFEETHPNIMYGELLTNGFERVYMCPVPDFKLSKVEIEKGDNYTSHSATVEIIIVSEGDATIYDKNETLYLKKGQVALLLADTAYTIQSNSQSTLFKATAPVNG